MIDVLKQGERLDDLHRNNYKIIQDPKQFCFGVDAVLLSDFAVVKKGERAIDLGTGTGIIPILLEAKTEGEHFTGLEIQPESADMAKRSVQYNKLESKVTIDEGDVKDVRVLYSHGAFHVVTSNPPYMNHSHGLVSRENKKAIARHEILCTLEDIISAAAYLLEVGGRFYMVHRPHRLVEIMTLCTKYKLEPKRMRMVQPYVDKEPNMVLIECIKGANSMIKVEPSLIIYQDKNVYTDEIYRVYGYKK